MVIVSYKKIILSIALSCLAIINVGCSLKNNNFIDNLYKDNRFNQSEIDRISKNSKDIN